MKTKRFRIVLVVLFVVIVGGVGWLVLRPHEPVYQGKRLSLWIEGYWHAKHPEEINEAIRQMGTNTLPYLLRIMRTRDDSPLKLKLVELAAKQKWDLHFM